MKSWQPNTTLFAVDGQEAAEKVLNETVAPNTEPIQSHIETVREQSPDDQENTMLDVEVTRYTFILRMGDAGLRTG